MLFSLRKVWSLMNKNKFCRDKHEICLCEIKSNHIGEQYFLVYIETDALKKLTIHSFLAMLTTSTLSTDKNDLQLFR